jgi:hypothetical protein
MAARIDWIPVRNHVKLHTQSTATKTYVDGKFGDFGINGKGAEWVNNVFKVKWLTLDNAYKAWDSEGERTPAKIAALQDAERDFIPAYRELYMGFLKNNPNVTDSDLVEMGLPKRKVNPPTPAPVPTTYPIAKIDISLVSRLTISYVDSHTGKKGKPKGVAGAVIHWAILPAPPKDYAELYNSVLHTNSPLVLDFTEEQRDKTVYFRFAWQNVRGEKGAYGEIVSARVP